MNSRKATAVAMSIIAIACRICGIFMSALPSAIAGYGVITSPFGGVFRLDYAIVAVILFVADYLLTRASRRVR